MTNVVAIRLELDTKGAAQSAREVAEQIRRSLGSIRVDNNVINLSDTRRQVQDLTGEILKANAALANPAGQQALQRQSAIYQEQIRFKRQLAQIDATSITPEGAANARALATELNRLNLAKINQEFSQLSSTSREGLQQMAIASAAVATAVGSVFVRGVQEFVEFDRQIRASGAIAEASAEEMEVLREEVTRLGLATTKTPAEIAQMSVELSRAGFTAEESAAALEGIVQASEATGESLSTVGDIIAKTLRAFNLSASQSGEVADLLVQTANSTNTSVGGLGDSLKYVSAQAKASDQDLSTVLTALGLLGDAGIQGTQAGTNLAEALNRLKIASAGSVTQFQGLVRGQKGATAAFEAIGAQVRNADGSLKQVTDILPIVRSQLAGLAKEDQDVLMRALFGSQGGRAFQTLLNASPDRIAEVSSAVENAQGAAGEASEKLRQGLGGAFSLFESASTTALQAFGELAAVPLEPLVRSATSLINTFNGLPAPIQATLIAAVGFTGVLAAATAAIAAYNLANGKLVIEQTLAAAGIVKKTVATTANTIASSAAAAAELVWARATGTATASQQAQIGAITANIAKFGLLAAAVGSAALVYNELNAGNQVLASNREAIDATREALLKLREVQASSSGNAAEQDLVQTDRIQANIAELESQLNVATRVLDAIRTGLGAAFNPIIDAINGTFDGFISNVERYYETIQSVLAGVNQNLAGVITPILNLLDQVQSFDLPRWATQGERIVNRQSVQYEEFRGGLEKLITTYEELKNSPDGLAGNNKEQVDILRASIDEAITGLEDWKETTPEAAASSEIYSTALANIAAQIDQAKDSQTDLGEVTEENTDKIGQQVSALEDQQKALKEAAEDARADEERSLNRQLDDERRVRQEDNAREIAEIQKSNAEEINRIEKENAAAIAQQEKADALEIAELEKQFQSELQETERTFEQEISSFEQQEQAKIQAKEQAFADQQQQQEAAFNAQERQIEQAFQDEQRQRNEAQSQSFSDAERIVALQSASTEEQRRTILEQERVANEIANLNLADRILNPEQIAATAQRLADVGSSINSEEEARRVQEIIGQIQSEQQRQQAEADRLAEEQRRIAAEAREAKFQEQQEQRRTAFEETIATQRATLEAQIEQRKLDFETNTLTPLREAQEAAIATVRQEQETQLTAIREEQELQLQALREQQETDLEARRSAFEESERALDRAYEDQKIERDRQYRAEQRQLDLANAQAIENLRTSNRSTPAGNVSTPTPRGLRVGGTYQAGEILQLHKDEFVIPSTDGTVLSQRASRQVVKEAIALNPQIIAASLRQSASRSRSSVVHLGRQGGDRALLKEIQGLRSDLRAIGRPSESTTLNVSAPDSLALLRAEARRLSHRLGG